MKKKLLVVIGVTVLALGGVAACTSQQDAVDITESVQNAENASANVETDGSGTETSDVGETDTGSEYSGQNSSQDTAQSDTDAGSQSADTGSTQSSASITKKEAKAIALARVSGATDSDIHIHSEIDDGQEVYEGTIIYNEMEYDFEISASTGQILEWEEESIYD